LEKYKLIVKLAQIKDFTNKGQDDRALELANTVDMKKVRNVEDINMIASLFLRCGMLLKARECYLELHDRVVSRSTIMHLINLAIRLKRPNEAEKFLKEYQKVSRDDFYGLIFRYNIDKLEGKSFKELIPTLEKLKHKEYIEAWAYELAKLYHKTGQPDKCIAECNDLIVWFGDGEYVDRAYALIEYCKNNPVTPEPEPEPAPKKGDAASAPKKGDAASASETPNAAPAPAPKKAPAGSDDVEEIIPDTPVSTGETQFISDAENTDENGEFVADNESEAAQFVANNTSGTEFADDAAANAEYGADNTSETDFADDESEAAQFAADNTAETAVSAPVKTLSRDDELLLRLLKEEGLPQPDSSNGVIDAIEEDYTDEDLAQADDYKTEPTPRTELELEPEPETMPEPEPEPDTMPEPAPMTQPALDTMAEPEPEIMPEPAPAINPEPAPAINPETAVCEYSFTEEGLVPIPENSKLAAFLRKEGTTLSKYFGYYAYINDIRQQIIKAAELILSPQIINSGIVVTGPVRADQLSVIKGLARIMNKSGLLSESACAVASASKVNKMDLDVKLAKLVGKCIVIEEAGKLSSQATESIVRLNERFGRKMTIILTDTRSEITAFLRSFREINAIFPIRIHLPIIGEEDMVGMVKYRIFKSGLSITKAVENELFDKIDSICGDDVIGMYSAAEKIIKAVLETADNRIAKGYIDACADGGRVDSENFILSQDLADAGL